MTGDIIIAATIVACLLIACGTVLAGLWMSYAAQAGKALLRDSRDHQIGRR